MIRDWLFWHLLLPWQALRLQLATARSEFGDQP